MASGGRFIAILVHADNFVTLRLTIISDLYRRLQYEVHESLLRRCLFRYYLYSVKVSPNLVTIIFVHTYSPLPHRNLLGCRSAVRRLVYRRFTSHIVLLYVQFRGHFVLQKKACMYVYQCHTSRGPLSFAASATCKPTSLQSSSIYPPIFLAPNQSRGSGPVPNNYRTQPHNSNATSTTTLQKGDRLSKPCLYIGGKAEGRKGGQGRQGRQEKG